MSHLKILDPIEGEKLFRLFDREPSSELKSDPAVSAKMKGEIGILRVKSFIIPRRTRSQAKKDSRPYYILVDDRCGSACDAFAATIQDYQAATILGVRTMGMLFGGEAFKLKWHGYALIVPVTQVISPKGRIVEGVGVQPDIEIRECKNGGEQCLEKAIELINDTRSD